MANDCDSILTKSKTEYESTSKRDFKEKLTTYYETHRSSSSDSTSGFNVGVIIPVDGYPVPVNMKQDSANAYKALDDFIAKYESEKQVSFDSHIKFSVLPEQAMGYWYECMK